MENLKIALQKIGKSIGEKKEFITSEATTISALIDPFIQALDYDISNPSQIQREYDADSRLRKADKVDIAILQDGKPIIFVECKKLGTKLDSTHVGQLNSYFVSVPELCYGILTNGMEYHFYKESRNKSNTMELIPFLSIDLTKNISLSQLKTLFSFTKTQFQPDELNTTIIKLETETIVKNFMDELITEELTRESEFFNMILDKTPFKGKKGENREFAAKTIGNAVKIWLDEHITTRINNMAKQQETQQDEYQDKNSNIVTTEEELEAYYIIKGICTEKIPASLIQYQDYQGFFSVYYDGKKTKHICKLFLTEKKKEIEIIDNQRILLDSIDDIYSLKNQLFQKIESLK